MALNCNVKHGNNLSDNKLLYIHNIENGNHWN